MRFNYSALHNQHYTFQKIESIMYLSEENLEKEA